MTQRPWSTPGSNHQEAGHREQYHSHTCPNQTIGHLGEAVLKIVAAASGGADDGGVGIKADVAAEDTSRKDSADGQHRFKVLGPGN